MAKNTYTLSVGGKTITAKGVNLKTAVESEGFTVVTMQTEERKVFNGKYIIKCIGNTTIYAEWVEKNKKIIPS